ncbi:hypothetical protein FBZ99_107158 [Rhizobium sp. ERR 1071]|nr:hypothetical protein FBZ99_107158 [Rhizobium sp. ERR1071]
MKTGIDAVIEKAITSGKIVGTVVIVVKTERPSIATLLVMPIEKPKKPPIRGRYSVSLP